nr:SDR family NAD(P)-dependent oxidoreductase [uncultured Albidiferax sp.]
MNPTPAPWADTASSSIAVIGIGCRYPGAKTAAELWENILGRRRQFRRMPDVRLPNAEYQSHDRATPDKTYGTRAAVIDGYAFDWAEKRIPKQTYESTDLAHWLALDVVLQMLQDAGYTAADLPRETTQVVVGNTLTGEFTRSNTLRSRWPFVNKMLAVSAADLGMSPGTVEALASVMERNFKAVFAPINEDTLAGGLANTIPGRICNFLNLNGGGFVVDGACASSLIAVHTAASNLASGQCDFAIAGGVDISLDPFELVGFAKTGALTPNEMSVYDKRGNGFIPGEGCGFVAMKRLSDAIRDGDKIYAVVDGWGMSTDGKGGITAPSVNGQSMALQRAYEKAGIDTESLDFIEGHGTGTAVGDKTELLGIARALQSGSAGKRSCGVTSLKSIVGHTKAAAGVGAFIKAVMAVNQRVVPPTAGCELPHEVFSNDADRLYPVLRGQAMDASATLRAGVSAMGFGGINLHVTLQSGPDVLPGLAPAMGARAAMVSRQADEVFCFADDSVEALRASVQRLQADAADASLAELADMASAWNQKIAPSGSLRAALVAASPDELVKKAHLLLALLEQPLAAGGVRMDADQKLVACHPTQPVAMGFVFPGQGSQRLGMARTLVERFDWAAELVAQADAWAAEAGTSGLANSLYPHLDRHVTPGEIAPAADQLQQTQLAQPAIVLCSLLWLKYMEHLGLRADAMLGHSLGELTAFYAAGAFDEKTVIQLATLRGQLMAASDPQSAGTMVSLACDRSRAEQLLLQLGPVGVLVIANINSPAQTVVSGESQAMDALQALASRENITAHQLPVSNAFHSPLVASAAAALLAQARVPQHPVAIGKTLISSCDGTLVDAKVHLPTHFSSQITRPVDFVAAAHRLGDYCGLVLEVGPGNVLSNMVSRTVSAQRLLAVPVERTAESSQDLNWVVALAHTHGHTVVWSALYARRIIKPFVPAKNLSFIVNPCERPFERAVASPLPGLQASSQPPVPLQVDGIDMAQYFAHRSGFIADVIRADLRSSQSAATPVLHRAAAADAPISATALPPKASAQGIHAGVLQLAATATGFALDQIGLEMSLLDDLNLDSIKASALIAEAYALGGVAGDFDNTATFDLTLALLAERVVKAMPTRPVATSQPPAAGAPGVGSALEVVTGLVARYTGFAPETLQPSLTFTDDLNLDSIKFGALVAEATQALGIAHQIAASDVQPTSIGALAQQLQPLLATPADAPAVVAAVAHNPAQGFDVSANAWVRSFEMHPLPTPRPASPHAERPLQGTVVAVQCDDPQHPDAMALARAYQAGGATVRLYSADSLLNESRNDIHHFVVLLPRQPAPDWNTPGLLADSVKRLRTAAVVSTRQAACSSLGYLQFNGLSAGRAVATGDLETACTTAFAASVHLERPALRVRVLDFQGIPDADFVATQSLAELLLADPYTLSHYAADGTRHTLQAQLVQPPEDALDTPNPLTWDSARDVVLVTGGAKGITAECAFAFAQATGVQMALVGSSPAPAAAGAANNEIARTLARYSAAGLSARYYACDMADGAAVRSLVATIGQTLGPVTGVVHGAGVNQPRRVEQSSEQAALQEISPKLAGAIHLCAALEHQPPKLLVGLSSIIGITGMPGNAWYAFSNEALNLCLQQFQARHPQTHTVSLAYSVWAEVGMGAKLGSAKHLGSMGISAIPPADGVAHFLAAVLRPGAAHQVVIASRLGELDTWRSAQPALPVPAAYGRFIGKTLSFEPGVELVHQVHLNLHDDLYLRDHYYQGVYLFPTVFGLEAMAQTVAKVLGIQAFTSLRLDDIGLHRPIVVGSEAGAWIQITALVAPRHNAADPVRVQVGIRTQHTGFRVDHFNATFVLAEVPDFDLQGQVHRPEAAVDIDPLTELYGGLLFQGPLFHRIRTVWSMNAQGALLDIEQRPEDHYYAPQYSRLSMLGDPSLRDAMLQSAQLSERDIFLPVHIDSLQICRLVGHTPSRVTARNRVTQRLAEDLVCDVVAVSQTGEPLERLSGYRLKRMAKAPLAATPADYVNPQQRDTLLFEMALAEACQTLRVTTPDSLLIFYPELSKMDRSRRRLSELPLFSEVVLKAFPANRNYALNQLEIHWLDNGKPVLTGLGRENANISLSHDRRHCLCVAGEGDQGCDIEPVVPRPHSEWTGLLGPHHIGVLADLVAAGDTLDEAGTRVWSAMESTIKALGGPVLELQVAHRHANGVLLVCGNGDRSVHVLTLSMALTRMPRKMVAMVVTPVVPAKPVRAALPQPLAQPAQLLRHHMGVGPRGQRKPSYRFMSTFKDTTTLRHSLDFPIFANWMGSVRELSVLEVARQLVPDFASGRWGMVTNESEIQILGDAHCMEVLEGRMYLSRAYGKYQSSIDMHFEWLKIAEDGSEQLIALSTMATTWVEIKGHGLVDVQPFPPYLEAFVAENLPKERSVVDTRQQHRPEPSGSHWALSPALGALVYKAPNAPKVEPELLRQVFSTTSAESNLVGNIYFANYYHWQKRLIDRYFQQLSPQLHTAHGMVGEFRFRNSQVRHLREAMPFDNIEVVMALKVLHTDAIQLHFDFYKLVSATERDKLAYGDCEAVWVQKDAQEPSNIPAIYTSALAQRMPHRSHNMA